MIRKNSITVAVVLIFAVSAFSAGKVYSFEVPLTALRLLAEAFSDPCPVCADAQRKKAYRILNTELQPGTGIQGTRECPFVKTAYCGPNEFVIGCKSDRIPYKTDSRGRTSHLPIMVFRFHTKNKHLVGVSKEDFTDRKNYRLFASKKKGKTFTGTVVAVKYAYGDGKCFIFDKRRNLLVVQCRLLDVQ